MVEKNKKNLLKIAGANGKMMPLYAAVLFGNKDVVKYLYNNSKELHRDDGWTTQNRGWLLEKCVENDMFDVALGIVESYQGLCDQKVLQLLARNPEAFSEKKSNFIKRIINSGMVGESHEKEDYALKLLQIIWGDIAKKSKKEIDDILRGPVDTNQDNKPASGTVEELQKLISGHIVNMHVEIQNNIIKRLPATGNDDQALQLQKLVSGHIAKMHVETQNLIKGPSTSSNIPNVPPSGNATKTYSSRIIFLAAETGNTKFVVPDLIWKVNDDGLSIFHIAVKHRHEGIYNLLYEIGSMKDLITPLKDQKLNTMLHLVGKSAKKNRLEDVSGVALQMQ
ncbi:putative ankyrin repeat-containing domain superfamily [Helianthus debilis subsp. tardiflorus]